MYQAFILKTIPKVLSQIDRDKNSRTYGCCDRNYWHLKTRDFSSAILQQSGLALALLYLNKFEGNIYYHHEYVKEWAISTVYFWKKIQLGDGSFNEYYPNEHGFPPTAFSLYAVCEIYRRLGMQDKALISAFKKTAKYLTEHIEAEAYNQELASITALYSVYNITHEGWILSGLKKKLTRILSLQSSEGWFPEYGGADIGYLSVSLDMLGEYYWMSEDEQVYGSLNKIIDFIQYFIHPDGSVGGEYASRNTTYFLPNGIEVMIRKGNKIAEEIKKAILQNSDMIFYFMDSVDDRYCSHYLLHSFLRAMEKETVEEVATNIDLPCSRQKTEGFFPQSGLYVYVNKGIYAVVGGKKGGVIKLYQDSTPMFVDCGYRVDYGRGKIAITNWQDDNWSIKQKSGYFEIEGLFSLVTQKIPNPILHIGLRIISFLVGNRIIGLLKKKMILIDKHTNIKFKRKIQFDEEALYIEDEILSPNIIDVIAADNFSLRHVASGKFYSLSDLALHNRKKYLQIKNIRIKQKYSFVQKELLELCVDSV